MGGGERGLGRSTSCRSPPQAWQRSRRRERRGRRGRRGRTYGQRTRREWCAEGTQGRGRVGARQGRTRTPRSSCQEVATTRCGASGPARLPPLRRVLGTPTQEGGPVADG